MPCGVTVKTIIALVDIGGQHRDLQPGAFLDVFHELGGGIQYAGHQGRHVFPGVVPLKVGRLISHHGIAGGVGFIEGVGREAAHLVEDVGWPPPRRCRLRAQPVDEVRPRSFSMTSAFFLLMARRTRSAWP